MTKQDWKDREENFPTPENYKSIYFEDEVVETVKKDCSKQNKLEEIESYDGTIKHCMTEIHKYREKDIEASHKIANYSNEQLNELELELKNEDDNWFIVDINKKINRIKKGNYGSKLHYYVERRRKVQDEL